MSKHRHRANQCPVNGKKQFPSHRAALVRAAKILANPKTKADPKGWQSYRCPHCNQWHLTSLKPSLDHAKIQTMPDVLRLRGHRR